MNRRLTYQELGEMVMVDGTSPSNLRWREIIPRKFFTSYIYYIRFQNRWGGKPAGRIDSYGHWIILIFGHVYTTHRIVYALSYDKELRKRELILFIDGNITNCCIINLYLDNSAKKL